MIAFVLGRRSAHAGRRLASYRTTAKSLPVLYMHIKGFGRSFDFF